MKRKKLEKKVRKLEKTIEAMKQGNRALIDAVAERNEVQDGINELLISVLMEERWGEMYNPNFKPIEFDRFKNDSGEDEINLPYFL